MLGHLHLPGVLAAMVASVLVAGSAPAVARTGGEQKPAPRYGVIDVGTLGGAQSDAALPGRPITPSGAVIGLAETTIADESFPNANPFFGDPSPVLAHAFTWRNGRITDLGALPGNNESMVFQVNASGVGAGASEDGTVDPLTGYPAMRAVLFARGRVLDLGTLDGGHESLALAINDRGQVAGFSSNDVLDPVSMFGWGTQVRSFIWERGVMRDLGTLGGPDAAMTTLNARGQIAGVSYTDATANPTTGTPTTHPFLWSDRRMRDLGTLGGTSSTVTGLNNRGQVAGASTLAGDASAHPFLWDGARLRDLCTLGGDHGEANFVDDAGRVVGFAGLPGGEIFHAFLWKHGAMRDLGNATSAPCSFAMVLNAAQQVVGGSCQDDSPDALLWERGREYDLNALAPSTNHLQEAVAIDARGNIVSTGIRADGTRRLFLLIRR
jgi:probable HAF family extracellular repeat protein